MDLYMVVEICPGASLAKRWWEQPGMRLEGARSNEGTEETEEK